MTSSMVVDRPETWGPEAHGAVLHIHEAVPSTPFSGTIILDVENNPDGACAGIGYTIDGHNINFLSQEACANLSRAAFNNVSFVGHNIKYDIQKLRSWGFSVSPDQIVWDTQLAEYVKDSTRMRYGLKHLVHEQYGIEYPDFKTLTGTGKKAVPIGSLPITTVASYCGDDVLFTYRIYNDQLTALTDEQKDYLERMELPTMRVLLEMEERGVQIDTNYIRNLDARFADQLSCVDTSLRVHTEDAFNPRSTVQVRKYIVGTLGLSIKTTSAEELAQFRDVPFVGQLLRHRELSKLRSTYTQVLLEASNNEPTYRLHARFNQTSTNTGRLSSSGPNLQNIPTRTEDGAAIREGFIAPPNKILVDADYSQIEPRFMAHFSQDPKLISIFLNDRDLYDSVTEAVGLCVCDEHRKLSKTLWLALAYNAGAWKIGQTAKIPTHQAQTFLDRMKKTFSQFFYWRSKLMAKAEIEGGVRTLFGRWDPLPAEYAHLSANYKIQGSAAEVMKLAIQETAKFYPVCTVHDEMIFELPDASDVPAIQSIMESVVTLSVPLCVEIGAGMNWRGAKP